MSPKNKNIILIIILVLLCVVIIPFLIAFYMLVLSVLTFFMFANLIIQIYKETNNKKEINAKR
jgi:flagellar basal body-associated protein FliL